MIKGSIKALLLVTILYPIESLGNQIQTIPRVKSIMVFSPHPDDDILGCGGTIAKHIKADTHVTVVYMTSGDAAEWPAGSKELTQLREKEATKATQMLGVQEIIFLREPDAHLRTSKKIIRKIANLLAGHQPDIIYIPHESDSHPDHIATHNIVYKAAKQIFQVSSTWNPLVLGYEVWTPLGHVSHASDISKEILLKLAALKQHETQTTYMDFVGAVEAFNKYRGIMMFMKSHAECFDMVDLLKETWLDQEDTEGEITNNH